MPAFGKKSRAILDTVDDRLVEVLERVVVHRDITIISGYRGEEEQREIFRRRMSKTDWPDSKHNRNEQGLLQPPAIAVDIAPWPLNWKDENEFVHVAGMVMQAAHDLGVSIRWGGNWDRDDDVLDDQSFQDMGHFELVL